MTYPCRHARLEMAAMVAVLYLPLHTRLNLPFPPLSCLLVAGSYVAASSGAVVVYLEEEERATLLVG